jgi:hypothetical protein
MAVPLYDVFSGHEHGDAIWLDAVEGLSNAAARMKQLAADKPGAYFVFSHETWRVVASIDTAQGAEFAECVLGSEPAIVQSLPKVSWKLW